MKCLASRDYSNIQIKLKRESPFRFLGFIGLITNVTASNGTGEERNNRPWLNGTAAVERPTVVGERVGAQRRHFLLQPNETTNPSVTNSVHPKHSKQI
jgi:hypothetical protein